MKEIDVLKFCFSIIFLFATSAFASVPHIVDKYGFKIDLPDGFTKLVTAEVPSLCVYDSYHGNNEDMSFVRVHIQKEDVGVVWNDEQMCCQSNKIVNICKGQGAKIISTKIIDCENYRGLFLGLSFFLWDERINENYRNM